MIKAVIFDLDGTLLDTLTDIMESVNLILEEHNFPTHELQAYKYFIGNGIEELTRKAFPPNISDTDFEGYLLEVSKEYSSRQTLRTKPYDGIIDMLKELNRLNIRLAILSNKPHEFTLPTVEHFFPSITFDMVFGARQGIPHKPAPDAVFEILDTLNLKKEDCLYVGDTATDMQTAVSAGIKAVGVSWGFRPVEELKDAGANWIVDYPKEISQLL